MQVHSGIALLAGSLGDRQVGRPYQRFTNEKHEVRMVEVNEARQGPHEGLIVLHPACASQPSMDERLLLSLKLSTHGSV